MNQDQKKIYESSILLVVFFLAILFAEWFYRMGFSPFYMSLFNGKMDLIRITYMVMSCAVVYLTGYTIKIDQKNKVNLIVFSAFIFIICSLGYNAYLWYNLFVYPIILVLIIPSSIFIMSSFSKSLEEESLFGISDEKMLDSVSYTLPTEKGDLVIHSGEQHIYVEGGSGAGKGGSIIEPLIRQSVEKDMGGMIFDEKDELGNIAYSIKLQLKKDNKET